MSKSSNAFLALAFRPFFWLGSLAAIVLIIAWIDYLTGHWSAPGSLNPILWHAHEMVFGFVSAIIAGFLLTVVQNWSGVRGIHGRKLAFLVLLWLAGRIGLAVAPAPSLWVSFIDLSFYPAVMIALVPYLRDPDLKVERVVLVHCGVFFIANLLVHLEALGYTQNTGLAGVHLAIGAALLIIVFMGGRVIPFFTESSIARSQPRTWPWVEHLSHFSIWAFVVADLFASGSVTTGIIAFLAGIIHLIRLYGWQVRRVRRIPLIWVLHLGYLWLVVGLFLSAFNGLGHVTRSLSTHAFTIGTISVVIYGMITRVSLGHTGRRLHPALATVIGYGLLLLSAVLRVFGPLLLPGYAMTWIETSSVLWILAFTIFLILYFPVLTQPRIDHKAG